MARANWSQAPDDDAAAMYCDGDGAARRRRVRAVRDFQRRAPGTAIAAQPEVLADGEWLGFGCGAHSTRRGCPLEKRRVHRGVRPAAGAAVNRRPSTTGALSTPRSDWAMRCSRAAPDGRRKSRRDSCGLRRGCLGPVRPRAGTVSSDGAAATGWGPDVADASGNASCSRSDDYFRLALELGFGLEYFLLSFVQGGRDVSIAREAGGGGSARMLIALGMVVGVLVGGPVHGAQAAAAGPGGALRRTRSAFAGDGALRAQLHQAGQDRGLRDGGGRRSRKRSPRARSPSARRRPQAGRSSRLRSRARAARCSMSWIVDPVSKGNEYSMSQILTEGFPAEAAAHLQDARRLVQRPGDHQPDDDRGLLRACSRPLRTTDSVLRRGGALASTAHRFPA